MHTIATSRDIRSIEFPVGAVHGQHKLVLAWKEGEYHPCHHVKAERIPGYETLKPAQIGVRTYTDKLTSNIWSLVGVAAICCTAVCLGFLLFAGKDIWSMMFIFALLIVGLVEAVQGMIIREKSLVVGGIVGFIAGIVMMGFILARIPLLMYWAIPLFLSAWVCMMIIPGYALNAKARKENNNR